MRNVLSIVALFSISSLCFAGKCGKSIFDKGVLRKYEYAPNTLWQNVSKFGSSTTTGFVKENLTATIDTGVTTGTATSTAQHFSSWGPCSALGAFWSLSYQEQYIEQNKRELLQEMAKGQGGHIDTIGNFLECNPEEMTKIKPYLQNSLPNYLHLESGKELFQAIKEGLAAKKELNLTCSKITVS